MTYLALQKVADVMTLKGVEPDTARKAAMALFVRGLIGT